ncbi:MAG: hypothetical protein HS105_11495 [Chloracidobacterium sp.]|nr:hypothetical protein [Chloracidobacterium sp.]MCO5332725.1 hypothetical protein [Pyrinomonadaceae bacterium]
MSVTVEIANTENLQRIRDIFKTKNNAEAIERLMEKVIRDHEPKITGPKEDTELPEEFWEDLFSSPSLPKGSAIKAVLDEREEAPY